MSRAVYEQIYDTGVAVVRNTALEERLPIQSR